MYRDQEVLTVLDSMLLIVAGIRTYHILAVNGVQIKNSVQGN
jgi:hypothetical protein